MAETADFGGLMLAASLQNIAPATAATIVLSASDVGPGATVTVTISNNDSGSPRDWVGLYQSGVSGADWLSFQFLNGSTSLQTAPTSAVANAQLTFVVPTAPGTYQLILNSNWSFSEVAASPIMTVHSYSTTPVYASFQSLLNTLPTAMQPRANALGSLFWTRESSSIANCITIAGSGQLGSAVNAAITANGPGAYCLQPGTFDQLVSVPAQTLLILSPGIYTQEASITLAPYAGIVGTGAAFTSLVFTSGQHGANIQIGAYASNFYVGGLTLSRTTTDGIDGDSGVATSISSDSGLIEDLLVTNQFDGMTLGPTGTNWIRNVAILGSQRHGIYMSNAANPSAPCQYLLRDVLVAQNGQYGVFLDPVQGQMSTGNWDGLMTYNNDAGGIELNAAPQGLPGAQALRLNNGYIIANGPGGGLTINGNTYGHKISNTVISDAQGPGISLGAGVSMATLRNVEIANNAGPGLLTSASGVVVYGSTFADNLIGASVTSAGSNMQFINDAFTNASGQQQTGILSAVNSVQIVGDSDDLLNGAQFYNGPAIVPAEAGNGPAGMQTMPAFAAPTRMSPNSCIAVTSSGSSLTQAVAAAILANPGPNSFCLSPGLIDTELHVPAQVMLLLAPGMYQQNASISLDGSGAAVIGSGAGLTVLNFSNGSHGTNILVSNNISNYQVSGLLLTRGSVLSHGELQFPTLTGLSSGDDGLFGIASTGSGLIDNLYVQNEFDGLVLGATTVGQQAWVRNVTAISNYRNGVVVTNNGTANGPANYRFRDSLFESNPSWGIYLSPDGGAMAVGPMEEVLTFANGAGGLVAAGSDVNAVNGLQISNSFFGTDGTGGEISLQSGSNHRLSDVFIEQAATAAAGLLLWNTSNVICEGLFLGPDSAYGVLSYAANLTISAAIFDNNGLTAATLAQSSAIDIPAGSAVFIYGVLFNNSSNTQAYGVVSGIAGVGRSGMLATGSFPTTLYLGP